MANAAAQIKPGSTAPAKGADAAPAKGAPAKAAEAMPSKGAPAKAADATPAKGARAKATDAAPGRKGKRKLIIIAAAALLLIAGAGGAAWYFFSKPAAAENQTKTKAETKAAVVKKPPVFLPMDPFTVNLSDASQERFLQIAFVFETTDAQIGDKIKQRLPAIRNRLLLLLSSKQSSELSSREGKEKLAQEIMIEAKKPLDLPANAPGIDAVHFSSLIIQ